MTAVKASLLRETIFYAVGGTLFAFGMEWITSNNNSRAKAATIRHALAQSATHIAWVPSEDVAGLARVVGKREPSYFTPWRSAATVFAALPWGKVLGAFTFQDGKCWVIAVQNGQVFSDTDMIFEDEAKAREVFEAMYKRQYWDYLFAPKSWGKEEDGGPYKRTKQIDLTLILRGDTRDKAPQGKLAGLVQRAGFGATPGVPLRKIGQATFAIPKFDGIKDRRQLMRVSALAILAIGAGVEGFVTLHNKKPPPPPKPTPYYPVVASAADMLTSCIDDLPRAMVMATTPGWKITRAACNPNGTAIDLKAEDYASLSTLTTYHPDQTDLPQNRTATIRTRLSHPVGQDTIGADLIEEDDFVKAIGAIVEHSEGQNPLGPAQAPAGAAPRDSAGQDRPRKYRVKTWTLETAAPPLVWQADLVAIPNITITSIELTQNTAQATNGKTGGTALAWKITGEAYVSQ